MSFDKFRTTSVFRENMKAYNAKCDLIVNQGGARSGKTISILQVLFLIAVASPKPLIISVVSRALPHLKMGAMRDFDNILTSYPYSLTCKNDTKSQYKIGRSIVEFFGADQLDKVHGPSRDILFINEANFVKFEVYDMLNIRTNGTVFIDFNPTRRFWIHDEIDKRKKEGNKNYQFIKTTYRDNELLPDKIRERIEAKINIPSWWRVYGEGEIGVAEGAIYENWRYLKEDEKYPAGKFTWGLDYGFYPDPDALVKVVIDEPGKKIFCKEYIYESWQGTKELQDRMTDICGINDTIVAESASPRTNYDLRKYFHGLKAVSKTKTIVEWIRIMQNYELIITADSYNLELELANYVWSDKRSGTPLDGYNHLLDGIRYVLMDSKKKIWRNW
jgi:phage terminase large subunit